MFSYDGFSVFVWLFMSDLKRLFVVMFLRHAQCFCCCSTVLCDFVRGAFHCVFSAMFWVRFDQF